MSFTSSSTSPRVRLQSAVGAAAKVLKSSAGAGKIMKELNDAALTVVKTTSPLQMMDADPALYSELLLTSARLNTRDILPSYCGLCWRTTMPSADGKGDLAVFIAGSHIESNCLLMELGGGGKHLKDGRIVAPDKVKDYLCCRTDKMADCTKLVSCEGVTGECEGKLKPILQARKANPGVTGTYDYGHWLWVAVAAILWRRIVHDCEKYFAVADTIERRSLVLSGLMDLEKALRRFLCSHIVHQNALRANVANPENVAAPTFKLFVTAAPTPTAEGWKPASMADFVRYSNVRSFVSPLSEFQPCPYLACFSMFDLHFVVTVDVVSELDSTASATTTWIPLQWPAASADVSQLVIPASASCELHPTVEKLLQLLGVAMSGQLESINQNAAVAPDFTAAAASSGSAQMSMVPVKGQCLSRLPDFISYQHVYPGFGNFVYGMKLAAHIVLLRRDESRLIEVCHAVATHPSAPSYWCFCMAEIVNGAVLATACSFRVSAAEEVVEGSVKLLAEANVLRGKEEEFVTRQEMLLKLIWPNRTK